MKPFHSLRSLRASLGLTLLILGSTVNAQMPSLTAAEKAAGWRLLFDGQSLNGWRGYKTDTPPSGWRAENGELSRVGEGGDLMTVEQFDNFELRLEWKITEKGNSGIIYRISTDPDAKAGPPPFTYSSGPEFQILHNAGHKDGANPLTSAGSNYAVNPPIKDVTRPVGEWNEARVIADGNHIEHWMNGVKLLEYDINSPDWLARVKASKFATMPWYGRAKRGYIALQDHGNLVTYRNVKIRPLGSKPSSP
jgi:hypothetical protein